MAVLTYLFGTMGAFALCDAIFIKSGVAAALPRFTAAAASLTGFLIAVVWYFDIKARERAKKKRNKALAAMFVNVIVCIAAVAYLIVCMLERLV